MDTAQLVLLSLALGLVLGGGLVALFAAALRRAARTAQVAFVALPDGLVSTVHALGAPAIVLDPSNNVLLATDAALSLGFVTDGRLTHAELVAFVDRGRAGIVPREEPLEVPAGPYESTMLQLKARTSLIGTRYLLLVAEDRSESDRLDSIRRDFLTNISHELKTPIAAVGLLADAIAASTDDPERVRSFAQRLTGESQRLAKLTQEIIELARLQSGSLPVEAERLSVARLIDSAIEDSAVVAEAKDVSIVRRRKAHAFVTGDARLLRMALNNLILNAVQYSPSGSRVGVGVSTDENGFVEIAVTDQGVGIPAQDLDRVFERFYRVDDARARSTGGSGLGLSIVKHSVGNSGGDVRVWSQPGRGSTFTIRLPDADASGIERTRS